MTGVSMGFSSGGSAAQMAARVAALEAEVADIKARAGVEAENPTATPGSVAKAVAGS